MKIAADDPIWEEIDTEAAIAGRSVYRRFGNWAEFDDLKQAALEYAWKRSDKVAEFMMRDDEIERRRGRAALSTFLRRAAERYARKEKAKKSGYQATDEYFYKVALVENLIRAVYNNDIDMVGQVFDAETMNTKRSKRLANEGNDVLAMVADIDRAMRKIDPRMRLILLERYGADLTLSAIAEMHSISQSRVDQIVRAGMKNMIEVLGGRSPY